MRLIACPSCHAQYDVTHNHEPKIRCRCGGEVENRELDALEASVYRCASCSAQLGADASACEYCGSAIERDERKLSLVCPECYSRNADDARFCGACGVTFAPQKVEVQGEELPCPGCAGWMAVRELVGLAVNECAKCNGLWVPGDRLDALVSRAVDARKRATQDPTNGLEPRIKSGNPAHQRVQYRKCPKCSGMMARRNFRKTSGIIIDQCPEHGIWLDADELEALAGFILSGGRPQAEKFLDDMESARGPKRTEFAALRARIDAAGIPRTKSQVVKGGGLLEELFEFLGLR